ncbi:reverse transcriptase domain-containing protein, partial [Tanacetum coccineum]
MSSDSSSSEVTYTSISFHRDPLAWAVDLFGLQVPDSPEAAPASPNYVPGPKEPKQAPPSPDYVPGPEYPEYLAPSHDEIVAEDQPYVDYASPATLSLGYIADSDPEEDPKDGPVDYLADGGDDDDGDGSSSDDDDKEASEEEEHLAPADSIIAPAVDPVPSFEETEPFETDESAATPPPPPPPLGARICIRPQEPLPFPSKAEVERLLALPTPPSSPLISLSPPFAEECLARCLAAPALPSSLLPILPHPYGSSNHVRAPRGFRAAMVDRKEDIPEVELPPRKRLCLTALTSGYEVRESSTVARPTGGHRADYGFIGTLDADTRPPTTLEGVNARVTELAEVQEEDTQDIYAVIVDAQDRQTRLSQRVDVLIEDKAFHQETVLLMKHEALVSREAWAQSVGLSLAVHQELQAYRTHTQIQDYRIASHESLTATLVAHILFLQGQLSAALGQIQPTKYYGFTNGHGDGSHNSGTGIRGTTRTLRECTYKDFLNFQPFTFKGTEGVVVLSQWFEKMESVFYINNCVVENQVKFATCTFLGNALTWWNSHMKTVTQDVAYAMDWKTPKKMMTVKYCPRGEIKKLEIKLWNLKVKGTDVAGYTLRFQELALICGRMFHEESNEVEKYVGGLPDMIRGNVMSYQPKTMEKAIKFANDPLDQKSSLLLKDKLSRRESWSLMLEIIRGTNNKT